MGESLYLKVEIFKKDKLFASIRMTKILISSIYHHESVMLCATKFSVDELFLIIDRNPNEIQQKAINIVKDSLGSVVKIHERKAEIYDIIGTAKLAVDIIDRLPEGMEVYINVTSGRKTQTLGLSYGAYARIGKVDSIVYATEETKEILYLPKLNYEITDTQRQMLELISENILTSTFQISEKVSTSTAMAYRNFETLKNKGMIIQSKDGIKLTDYGRLVLL
jgi:CRISPR locus-related DNA-binding protein